MAFVADRNLRIAAALAALYVIWGTTYYVIRQAVDAMPPLTMAAIRFLIPGLALYLWTRMRGVPAPGKAEWKRAAILGGLMLAIGNGAVSYAETDMPSGIAALLVAAVPMWTVVLDWTLGGNRPRPFVVGGLALGVAGVALLVTNDPGGWTGGGFSLAFVLLILVGCGAWALGSLRSRHGEAPKSFWQDLAMQMLAGGAFLVVGAVLLGEPANFHPATVPASAWLGIAYLSVFGSIVALGCFLWLLRTTSPAMATTYAFVNPAVAVLVGVLLGDQPLSWLMAAATLLIILGVALIVAGRAKRKVPEASPQAPAPEVH